MQTPGSRYITEELDIQLSGRDLKILRVTNTDELYAELVAKGEDHEDVADERIPYWADLWPSSLALAKEVFENPLMIPGAKVLEIGCGLALPGIAAGMRGADVLLTDYLQEPLDFACRNWKLNLSSEPRSQILDWRNPDPGLSADLILASDVAYEKRSFDGLLNAFRTLLKPGGTILLSEPNRLMAKEFFKNLSSHGFKHSSKTVRIALNGRDNEVCVYYINYNSPG
jgi:predicted nicotinamide N-methyase